MLQFCHNGKTVVDNGWATGLTTKGQCEFLE